MGRQKLDSGRLAIHTATHNIHFRDKHTHTITYTHTNTHLIRRSSCNYCFPSGLSQSSGPRREDGQVRREEGGIDGEREIERWHERESEQERWREINRDIELCRERTDCGTGLCSEILQVN